MDSPHCLPHLSSGIAELDLSHQAIIKELSMLLTAPEMEIGWRLQRLVALLEQDFREEECLMEKIDFAGLLEHREHHAKLLSALHHVVPSALNGDYQLARQVLKLLPHWFLGHLIKMDKPLIEAIQASDT